MKYLTIFILIISILSGCASKPSVSPDTIVSNDVGNIVDNQNKNIENLENSNTIILDNAEQIIVHSDTLMNIKDLSEVSSIASQIKSNAVEIRKQSIDNSKLLDESKRLNSLLENSVNKIKDLEKQIAFLISEQERSRQESIQKLYDNLSIFFGLGFLVILGGIVVAIFVNVKIGIGIVVVGILGLGLAAGSIYYLKAIANIGISIIIGTIIISVGLGLYYLIKQSRDVKVVSKATEENVKLIEKIKPKLDDNTKKEIFGDEGLAKKVQSPETQKLVSKIRTKSN